MLKRWLFKKAVMQEFRNTYGLDLADIGRNDIGKGTLDDILNLQYETIPSKSQIVAVKNIADVLETSFKIDITKAALYARVNRLPRE